jgi:hypothetical protein
MLALLGTFGTGIGRGTAAAATFVTRACTLWFAVAVGLGALALYGRRGQGALTATLETTAGATDPVPGAARAAGE